MIQWIIWVPLKVHVKQNDTYMLSSEYTIISQGALIEKVEF